MNATKTIESQPVVKDVKPINFLYFRTETYLNELINYIPVARELMKEAVNLDIHVTGALHWHYFGFTGDASKPFTLEISLPVANVVADYDGSFHFKRTESFRCVALTHEGGWDSIPEGYATIMQFMASERLKPIGVTREIYINSDFQDPTANVTEIQMGVQ